MEQDTVIYKAGLGGMAGQQFAREKKKREKAGWKVQSVATTGRDGFGRDIVTAIYVKGDPTPVPSTGPQLNIVNLPPLLQILSPEERAEFEGQVQKIVNDWWLRKGS